jgi:hypothetical protein
MSGPDLSITHEVIAELTCVGQCASSQKRQEAGMTGFWKAWMQGWCSMVGLTGVMFACVAIPGLEGPALLFYDVVYWPVDGQSGWVDGIGFTVSILGAVLIGWALTCWTLVAEATRTGSQAAWRGITAALVVWYVIDSSASVATGVPGNAVSNTLFLASFLLPVLASGALRGASPTPQVAR